MERNFNTRTQSKRGTTAEWENYNPVLKDGEIIVVSTSGGKIRLKCGDGTTAYKDLPFINCTVTDEITLVQADN